MKKYFAIFKENRPLSIGTVVVVVLIILGAVFLLTRNSSNSSNQQASQTPAPTEQPVLKIAPTDLGITLTAGPNNQTAVLGVADTNEIVSLDYELSYMATVNGAQVARGAIGHIDIKNKGTPVRESITLGTCSDVCHYDVGVSDIAITLKITKTDGKIYQSNLTLNL
jgi:hypothetical protein